MGRLSILKNALAEERFATAVLNALQHPVFVVSREGTFVGANQAAEQFFGAGAAILMRHGLDHFVPFDSPLLALLRQVSESGAAMAEYRVDVTLPRSDVRRVVDVYASPFGEAGDRVAFLFLTRSVTDKIDRQLTHRGAARTVTGLAAMLAHEIKNPLSGIRGAAQLLETSASDEDRHLTRLICDETDRVAALVNRMELFVDERPVKREAVNIHVVLERVKTLAARGFARGVRIIEDYDPSLPYVYGNRDQLVQVFLNLVKNAAEAVEREPNPEITLKTSFRPGIRMMVPGTRHKVSLPLEFSVIDNGVGVPDDLLPYLFDPFVTTKANGSGLGLALVAKIIGDHGGVIECTSRARKTTFKILMPAHQPEGDEGDASTEGTPE